MKFTFSLSLLSLLVFGGCSSSTELADQSNPSATYSDVFAQPNWYTYTKFDTLTILSWNVEHFVDEFDNPYIDNDRENNPPQNIDERRELVSDVIKRANADVVVLQEFESDSYAQQFAEEYFPELGYQIFSGHESSDWYMNVVMMSRVPLGLFHSYATSNTPIPGQLDEAGNPESQTFINNRMWTAEILVNPEYHFFLTGVHLKAGRGERNESWRMGQMNLLRYHYDQLLKQNPDANILAVGDFNSTPESPEMELFLGEGTDIEFIDPLAETEIFSHPADSAFWRIDHILPNTNMIKEVVNGSVKVNYYFSPDSMNQAADHLPMTIKIIPVEN